jgi:hypothetical protein
VNDLLCLNQPPRVTRTLRRSILCRQVNRYVLQFVAGANCHVHIVVPHLKTVLQIIIINLRYSAKCQMTLQVTAQTRGAAQNHPLAAPDAV